MYKSNVQMFGFSIVYLMATLLSGCDEQMKTAVPLASSNVSASSELAEESTESDTPHILKVKK